MAGTVYLRTNRFEVKLEGITFKTSDFEALCKMDFLFPDGKVWVRPPIVGLDVMRHPRDPSVLLVLLCFGVGCVILRFPIGKPLPFSFFNFLSDKRIQFVSFGIPEKRDLFPFDELGLTKSKVDIGYLAVKILKDPKCKRWELAQLARQVIGIKRMIGMTESSSFERHEQIKCAICQLFITSVIAMGLLGTKEKKKPNDASVSFLRNLKSLNSVQLLAEGWFKLPTDHHKKNMDDSNKKGSFLKNLRLKNLNSNLIAEGWFKLPKRNKKINPNVETDEEQDYRAVESDNELYKSSSFKKDHHECADIQYDESGDDSFHDTPQEEYSSSDDLDNGEGNEGNLGQHSTGISCSYSSSDENSPATRKPLKGILKCPSACLTRCNSSVFNLESSPSTSDDQTGNRGQLRRANSKGCNVSFKCH